ncbi:MAG TPA: hypothetical protein VKV06_05755, partial [Acidimicrobiales bacterium]|nr:hypothetical protein [Acidimicrobiales bacterium]
AETVRDWPAFDGEERPQLLEILRRSVSAPTSEEARVFGAWTHDDNFGVDLRERVIPDRLGTYVPYLSPADLVEMTMQEAFWPLGLAAEYDQELAAAAQAILAGHVSRGAFDARRHPRVVEMAVDTGHGWTNLQSRPLRINHNGLSYVHFDLRGEGIKTVRLDPCDGPALWRVDWIELGLRIRGAAQATRIVLQDAHELSMLGYSGSRWLYDGVGISTGADPELHIPLAGRAPGEVYGVELTAALAVLPLPPAPHDQQIGVGKRDYGTTLSWALDKLRTEAATGGPAAAGRSVLRMARHRPS